MDIPEIAEDIPDSRRTSICALIPHMQLLKDLWSAKVCKARIANVGQVRARLGASRTAPIRVMRVISRCTRQRTAQFTGKQKVQSDDVHEGPPQTVPAAPRYVVSQPVSARVLALETTRFTTVHAPGRSTNQQGRTRRSPGGRSMPGRRGVLVLFVMADCFLTISCSRRI